MKHKTYLSVLLVLFVFSSIVTTCSARIFDRIIAFVNDDVITQRRLDILVNQRAFELQQIEGYSEREALQEAEKERGDLLDRLIRQMLLLEAALTLKVQVTDTDIEEQIEKFKTEYKIPSDEEFKRLLNRDGLTLAAFREQLQRNLMTEKLVMGRILPRLQVRESDVQKFYEENRDQLPTKADRISISQIYIAFKLSDAAKAAANNLVNQVLEEIRVDKTEFENVAKRVNNKQSPSTRTGQLIEITPAEILTLPDAILTVLSKLKAGEISDPIEQPDGIHVFMVETRSDEKITFRHLTIPFVFSDEDKQVALETADNIVKKLEAGEEFADVAKAHSDDTETREKGGDLGTQSITALNPQIREIVEPLEVGKFSEPFESNKGIYIYKVDERKIPELTAQEKQQIIGILRQRMFEKEWTAYTDSLIENAYIKIKPDAIPTQETKED